MRNYYKPKKKLFLKMVKFLLLVGENWHFITNLNHMVAILNYRENLIAPVEYPRKSMLRSYFLKFILFVGQN